MQFMAISFGCKLLIKLFLFLLNQTLHTLTVGEEDHCKAFLQFNKIGFDQKKKMCF